eukprot:59785_1
MAKQHIAEFSCIVIITSVFSTLLLIFFNDEFNLHFSHWNMEQSEFEGITPTEPKRPNIIFILADDLGYHDVSFNNGFDYGVIVTPNIDNLASNGIILSNYYTLCICSASRGVILTGRYDIRNGLRGIAAQSSKRGISLNELLISDILRQYGDYTNYALGKWHVGKARWQQTPTWRGFDYFYGMLGGAGDYFTHFCALHAMDWSEHIGINCSLHRNTTNGTICARICEEDYGIYSTHLLSDKAIHIINNHSSSNNENNPFFIYLSYQAIHSPGQVPDEYVTKFKHLIAHDKRRVAAGMINCLDEGIGNITSALQRNNLLHNTIIIFTSDNGAAIATGDSVGGENWPLRGGKHSIYEGGTKVPAVIYYEKLKQRKYKYNHLFHSSDWLPTIIEATGIDLSTVAKNTTHFLINDLDGKSHWNNLNRLYLNQQTEVRQVLYYGNNNPIRSIGPGSSFGIRYKNYKALYRGGGSPDQWYKYIHNGTHSLPPRHFDFIPNSTEYAQNNTLQPHLYDIARDPLETTNIYHLFFLSGNRTSVIQDNLNQYKDYLNRATSGIRDADIANCTTFYTLHAIETLNISQPKVGVFPGC